MNGYEPSEYDPPTQQQQPSLLMYPNDTDYMFSNFPPNNPSTFDHGSPSSNASGVDENDPRPPSVSSNHPSPGQPHASPRLSVNFGNMSVNSPHWGTVPFPQLSPNLTDQSPLPVVHNSQSPPRLLMPDDLSEQQQQQNNVPTISAPHGDGDMLEGPQLHIVPATPVSGGGSGRPNVPFQTTLATLNQGPDSSASNGPHQLSQQRDPSPSRFQTTEESSAGPSSSQSIPNNSSTTTSGFIFPPQSQSQQQPRLRTHSDPWNPNFLSTNSTLHNACSSASEGYEIPRQHLQSFTFGGSATGVGSSTSNNGNENGLSSHHSIRRAVSDSLGVPRPTHHRQSRSEDIRSPQTSYAGSSNNTNGLAYHHQQSNSIGSTSTTFLFPPSRPDFLTPHQQFLHPPQSASQQQSLGLLPPAGSASNPNLSPSPSSNIGHFRRASFSTRSDRGADLWGTQGHHAMTLGAPRRMSPYPTPNASPRGAKYTELEYDSDLNLGGGGGAMGLDMGLGLSNLGNTSVSAGFGEEIRGTYSGPDVAGASVDGSQKADSVISNSGGEHNNLLLPSHILKVNVTTGRTASASHRRRKQEANFACTVPGCGSTFTRGFNLKGHLRSHFEEKPYKCHWPGCGKGFARQHDCKRHEQLHSNFRPFECEGCRKPFARMDALNRHMRSEAGMECARIVERGKGAGGGGGMVNVGGGGGHEMSMIGGGNLDMDSEDEKPRRWQTGNTWPGVAL